MPLPNIFGSMNSALKEIQIHEILRANERTEKYGLRLTATDALELVEARDQVLQNYGRIELDAGVIGKLINLFCTSPFIAEEDYVTTLKDLQEIFYYMKNETDDDIGDDDLLAIIKNFFDSSCGGSTELLKGKELEDFLWKFRRGHPMTDLEGDE